MLKVEWLAKVRGYHFCWFVQPPGCEMTLSSITGLVCHMGGIPSAKAPNSFSRLIKPKSHPLASQLKRQIFIIRRFYVAMIENLTWDLSGFDSYKA